MIVRSWLIPLYGVIAIQFLCINAYLFGSLGCHPFDPDDPEANSSPQEVRIKYQANKAVWDDLQETLHESPEQRRYIEIALSMIKQCSIRRMEEDSIKDLEQFQSRCKKPFSPQEAADLCDEFEAHFLIVKSLRKTLEIEISNSSDNLQDLRTRHIRFALRVHEAIARSMELLPLPLTLEPGFGFIFFVVIFTVITTIILFVSVGSITALKEREPQRIQDGILRLNQLWNRAKVTVFQAKWDKNKVSIRTYPPIKPTNR